MSIIRCTVCGSDDVEVRAFVKPNSYCECSTDDFTSDMSKIEDCFCCECEDNTILKYFSGDVEVFGGDDLYDLVVNRLKVSYVPDNFEDETISNLADQEYLRVKREVCLQYGFDEDEFMEENGGESPFDEYKGAICQEVYSRIKKTETALSEEERFALWHKGEQEMFITSIEIFYKASDQSVGGSDDLFYDLPAAKNRIKKYIEQIEPGYLDNRTIKLEIRPLDLPLEERGKYCDVQSIFNLCDFLSLPPIETMQL